MRNQLKIRKAAALLIGMQVFVLLMFTAQKKGYFIDEIYSWGLSNGYYKPFVVSYDVFGRWVEGSELQKYMTVQPGEFSYGSVFYNQSQDVHPPFFYLLLHTICSFTPDVYGIWQGMVINVVAYTGCLVMIFLTARLLWRSDKIALAAMAVWGLSPGALSTGVYIRMYMTVTFFASVSMYLHVKMWIKGQTLRRLAGICLVTFLGLLTQYYFVFFAFFLSAVYVLGKLKDKRWREAFIYSAALIGAVGAMVLTFPACITQLTRNDEFVAQETRSNLASGAMLATNIISYISCVNMDFLGGWIRPMAVGGFLVFAVCLWKGLKREKTGSGAGQGRVKLCLNVRSPEDKAALSLTLALGGAGLAVAWAAVVPGARYIYNLYPVMAVLATGWVSRFVLWCLGKGKEAERMNLALLAALLILFVRGYSQGYVQYLYPENEERIRLAASYQQNYCLYINNGENAPLTQDLIELSAFRGLYAMPKEDIVHVNKILEEKGINSGIVVYVDTNEFWSSGYDGEEVMEELKTLTGYSRYRLLYSHELSETYILE